ncbi:MAG: hypothetical protein CVU88_04915 [Firmicutes bacterium HGW-Firmicutes-13]|nr:MAG: hypothetical protein CVU88_04915 [Firmicutes bacterium HGW-Firmicutes-13]
MNELTSWIVSFDTDQIKNYIFSTNRLKEIRGASSLLLKLDRRRKKWIKNVVPGINEDNIVYSAGGGTSVLLDNEDQAKKVIAEVSRNFLDKTVTATITGVLLPPTSIFELFGQRMKQAGEQLRQAKEAKAELTNLPVEPYLHLCHSCEKYPAVEIMAERNNELLCKSCAVKRSYGDRSEFYQEFLKYVKKQDKNNQIWKKEMLPKDLDTIGKVAYPPGYIGLIALDGNHMGNFLNKLKKKEDYQEFSKRINCLVMDQTFTALKRYGQPRRLDTESYVAPFEIVIMGGDDVFLITAADIAIEVALSIAEGFEEGSKPILEGADMLQEKITMAGGVVLAHAKFPIPAMYKISEELQKSAKKICAENKYQTGALDFVVVSSSDTDLEEMRSPIPHYRPYLCKNLRKLVNYIRRFKKEEFPTSQLQAMYQSLFAGKINAQLAAIATLGRLCQSQDQKKYKLLRNFFKDFDVAFNGQLPPWTEKKITALADLVELYPFIGKEGEEK